MGLNDRVRDGHGCDPHAIATNHIRLLRVAPRDVGLPRARCEVGFPSSSLALVARLATHPRGAAGAFFPPTAPTATFVCLDLGSHFERPAGLIRHFSVAAFSLCSRFMVPPAARSNKTQVEREATLEVVCEVFLGVSNGCSCILWRM